MFKLKCLTRDCKHVFEDIDIEHINEIIECSLCEKSYIVSIDFESGQCYLEHILSFKEQRELFADLCHQQWSNWMKYLFDECIINPDGTVTVPKWAVDRWKRQLSTDYKDLLEEEKNSDRIEADKFLNLFYGDEG